MFSRTVGREGGMLQTNNTGVCSQCLSHTGSAPAHSACSLPAHTAQALGCSAGNHPWPAVGCLHHKSVGKESACSAGDLGSIPELGRPPGEGNGNPLQYSYLENPMDGGTWQATIHAVARVGHNLRTKPPSPPPYRHPES